VDLLRNIILFTSAALIVRFVFNEKYFENAEKIIKWIPNLIKYDNLFILLEFCLIIGLFSIARIIARPFIAMKGIRFFLISFLGILLATFGHKISEYLSVSIRFWLEKIADILSKSTGNIFTFANFINFIAATLLGVFLFLFLRWISSSSGIQILAFDDSDSGLDSEKKEDRLLMLNGSMIADLLAAELHRIDHIYKFIEDGKLQVVQTSSSLLGICRENLELSLLKGEHLENSLTQAGSLPITDKTTLQLGSILLAIRQLWPVGLVQVISGSIEEFISTDGHLKLKLTARYERTNYHSDIHAYNIDQESSDINDMVKNLAYRIALDASPKPILTSNWEAFKFFTEAMSSFYRYERTKSPKELDKSFELCEDANEKDKNYKKVGDLLSFIGFAYLNRDQYEEAKKSLEKALKINPNSVSVQIFVGDLYYLSGEYDKAFKHYEYAKKLDPHCPEIYIRTSRIHIVAPEPHLEDYDQARKDLWYVLNLEPSTPHRK
jgi:tetratricopeptide (TPR) repeat protein